MEFDQEIHTQNMISSSKKRPFMEPSRSSAKKRVALGDITNDQNPNIHAQKLRPKRDGEFTSNQNKPKCDLVNFSYSSSVYQHLRSLEMEDKKRPLPNYMEKVQKDITANMREVLVDWLVEVAEEYKLVSDTLYLTVSYIDRFLSSHALSRNKLQLLGVSCMLIASKYEEVAPPHVEDFCFITDNTCTKNEIVDMEKDVLKFFNFEMSTPTPKSFLRIFMRVSQFNGDPHDSKFEFLNCYLTELSLLDYRCVKFLPSVIASSAVFLSRLMICPNIHPWSMELQCYSGYKPSDLKDCVLAINELLESASGKGSCFRAVRLKYMEKKYKCVAELSSQLEVPSRYFETV